MSGAAEFPWKGAIATANFYGVCGIVFFEAWSNREIFKLSQSRLSVLYERFLLRMVEPEQVRFEELRFANFSRVIPLIKGVVTLALMGSIIAHLIAHKDNFLHYSIQITLAYFCSHFVSFRLTPRTADMFVQAWLLLITAGSFHVPWDKLVATSTLRAVSRAFLSVSCMNTRATFPINFLHVVVMCIRYVREKSPDPSICLCFCVSEAIACSFTTCLCLVTEAWFKEVLHNEAAAHAAKRAAERLLSSYCDTVLRLGPDLRITQATPKLMHLICPTRLADPSVLNGTLLDSYLATKTDKERFARFILNSNAESTDGLAPALCVSLHHELGCEKNVELVHVNLSAHGRAAEHLIGIREVRPEGIPPDESEFQGSKTSFTHSPDREGVASLGLPPKLIPFPKQIREPSRSSRSSRSSLSSGSSGPKRQKKKRRIHGVDRIQLKFNGDFQLDSFTLCFQEQLDRNAPTAKPDIETCLIGGGNAPFMKWLHTNTNTLLWDPGGCCTYLDELWFRPPSAACASSTVVLCADSVKLYSLQSDADAGDEDDDSSDLLLFELQLFHISELVNHRPNIERTRQQLQVLTEENVEELGASR